MGTSITCRVAVSGLVSGLIRLYTRHNIILTVPPSFLAASTAISFSSTRASRSCTTRHSSPIPSPLAFHVVGVQSLVLGRDLSRYTIGTCTALWLLPAASTDDSGLTPPLTLALPCFGLGQQAHCRPSTCQQHQFTCKLFLFPM